MVDPTRSLADPTRNLVEQTGSQWNIVCVGHARVGFALFAIFFRIYYPKLRHFLVEYGLMLLFTDIDECANTPDPCGVGYCWNNVGSYTCICPKGYHWKPDIAQCKGKKIAHIFQNFSPNQSQPLRPPLLWTPLSNYALPLQC